MKRINLPLALFIISFNLSAQDPGERFSGEFCQPPGEIAARVIQWFIDDSDEFNDGSVTAVLRKSTLAPLDAKKNKTQCTNLIGIVSDKIVDRREKGEAKGSYLWDVSFFKVGELYAVVYIETPNSSKKPEEMTALDRAWPGQAHMIELFDSDFQLLGRYDGRGYSLDYDNKVKLRPE